MVGCIINDRAGKADLRGNWDSELLWQLLRWEKLPVSKVSPSESVLGKSRRAALFPLWPLPHRQRHIPKAPLPYNLSGAPRQRNMAQMKEQNKTSERALNDEDIANLSDGEL